MNKIQELIGLARKKAVSTIIDHHYTHSIPRGKSYSGDRSLTKSEIESKGFTELKLPGKERFVKPISRVAVKLLVT